MLLPKHFHCAAETFVSSPRPFERQRERDIISEPADLSGSERSEH